MDLTCQLEAYLLVRGVIIATDFYVVRHVSLSLGVFNTVREGRWWLFVEKKRWCDSEKEFVKST
jgi:hypothetical protein